MLQRLGPRTDKASARYVGQGSAAEHCSLCRFWFPTGSCARVEGRIVPRGWCKFFSREMVQGHPGSTANIFAGPSLDLSFMFPGALDPRITFTRASTATYFNNVGVMQTAAANAPRWDYNPSTLALNGLLIEEARTNAVPVSVPDAGVHWNISGPATQGGSVTAPDGTTSTTSLIAATDTTNSIRQLAYASGLPVAASSSYSITVFLRKSASGNANAAMQCNISGGATVVPMAYFDLTNGVAVVGADLAAGATNLSASIVPVGSGWYRARFSFTTTSTSSGLIPYIGPCTTVSATGDNRSYVGAVGQGIYVWGLQHELGTFPTSYIPTAGAQVARAADLASVPTSTWFNTTNGTYQAEFIPNGAAATLPVVISGNAGSPVIATGADSRLVASIRSGAAVFSATGPLFAFRAVNKAAFGYLSGASTAAVNGTAIGPSATALTVTGTVVEFGSDGVTPGNNALDGWLRRVSYWPRILSNAEMQAVTT